MRQLGTAATAATVAGVRLASAGSAGSAGMVSAARVGSIARWLAVVMPLGQAEHLRLIALV